MTINREIIHEHDPDDDYAAFDSIADELRGMLDDQGINMGAVMPTFKSLHPDLTIRETVDVPEELKLDNFSEDSQYSHYRERLTNEETKNDFKSDRDIRREKTKLYGRWYLSPTEYSVVGDILAGNLNLYDEESSCESDTGDPDTEEQNETPQPETRGERARRENFFLKERRKELMRLRNRLPQFKTAEQIQEDGIATARPDRIIATTIENSSSDREYREILRHASENERTLEDLNSARKFKAYLLRTEKYSPHWMQDVRADNRENFNDNDNQSRDIILIPSALRRHYNF